MGRASERTGQRVHRRKAARNERGDKRNKRKQQSTSNTRTGSPTKPVGGVSTEPTPSDLSPTSPSPPSSSLPILFSLSPLSPSRPPPQWFLSLSGPLPRTVHQRRVSCPRTVRDPEQGGVGGGSRKRGKGRRWWSCGSRLRVSREAERRACMGRGKKEGR